MTQPKNIRVNIWKNVILLIPIFIIIVSFRQAGDQKNWDKNSPLTWDDFKGVEKDKSFNSETRSNTFIGELHRFRRLGNDSSAFTFEFQVKSVMVRSKSWVDPKYKTRALLEHEQLHFDLSEYFARQLLLVFQKAKYSANFKNEIQNIRHLFSVQREKMENLYDEQTQHSLDRKMQTKWNSYVRDLLINNESINSSLKNLPSKNN